MAPTSPTPSGDASQTSLGAVLVALQFAIIGTLAVLAALAVLQGGTPIGAWALGVAGALLGLWALQCNRPGNFNIRPVPRAGGHLVQAGPYRLIRHPMYTAVIAIGAACAWVDASIVSCLLVVALALVLAVKASIEESGMLQAHSEYAAYRARTKRFVPWLY